MMSATGVSCIVCSYNDAEYIHECIASIEASSIENCEIIIVNDGSTDQNSIDILNDYSNKGYVVINKPNGGVGSARNTGIRQAKYDFVVAIDADDKISVNYLKEAHDILDSNKSVDVVYANVQRFGSSTELNQPGAFDRIRLLAGNYIAVSAVYRKKIWQEVKGYDETLPNYEDWEFWVRCVDKGADFSYLPVTGLLYRKRGDSKVARCADPAHRERVVQQIIQKNAAVYDANYTEIIAKLHWTITLQEATYQDRLKLLEHADNELLVKELEQLKAEKKEMQQYYEGSVFWKLKLMVNRLFKSRK